MLGETVVRGDERATAPALIEAVDRAIARVRTRAVDVSFNELRDMHGSRELIIDPAFQRLFRWSEAKQSQFIESLILELPVPPIYVIEMNEGIYELIDGLQRISSYLHFRSEDPREPGSAKRLRLSECDVLPELNGRTYDELPQAVQIKLKRHFIRMEVLRRESDHRLRYHMFKRLNTGGELLSPQEIRNSTIRLLDDRFNDFLKELAREPNFVTCMSALTDEKRDQMYMEEYVLRFFALKNNRPSYEKDIGDFLTEYMEGVSDPESPRHPFAYAKEQDTFKATFGLLARALGENAFSGVNEKGNPQGYFSALHFEALTLGIQSYLNRLEHADQVVANRFRDALLEVKRDPEFQKLTKGGGKNYAAAMNRRISFVEQRVGACLA